MGRKMMAKVLRGRIWKALEDVLRTFSVPEKDWDLADTHPQPTLTVRYAGQEQSMTFPARSERHNDAPRIFPARLRRMIKEMQMASLGGPAPEEVSPMNEQSNLPLFADIAKQQDQSLKMSSREIAELTGKQHAHVMRDIRVMLDSLDGQSNFGSTYADAQGKQRECYLLPKRETLILVSGYSIALRARIIDRWQELEDGIASRPVLDFSDPKIMLGVFTHLQEQVAARDGVIAKQGERLKTLDRIEGADGSMCITDAAKTLKRRPRELTAFMSSRRWIYKRVGNKNWIGFQDKIVAGYLEHDEHLYLDKEGKERASTRVLVTAKGLVKLSDLIDQQLH